MIMAQDLRAASARGPVRGDQRGRVQLEPMGRIIGNIGSGARLDNPPLPSQKQAANLHLWRRCRLRQNLLQHIS